MGCSAKNEIALTIDENGNITKIDTAKTDKMSKSELQKSYNAVFATATKDSEIYHYQDNQYFTLAYDNVFQLTDKIDVNIDDFASNEAMFKEYSVSEDARKEMEAVIAAQKAIGNKELSIEIYAPLVVSDAVKGDDAGEVQLLLYGGQTTTDPYSGKFGGVTYSFYDIITKYQGLSASKEIKGSTAASSAKAAKDLVVSTASSIVTTISGLFGAASSLFSWYTALVSTGVVTGSSGDIAHEIISYARLEKRTFINRGSGYNLGCITHKVWLDILSYNQQYYNSGTGTMRAEPGKTILNKEIYSPNYWNAAAKAAGSIPGAYYDETYLRTTIIGPTTVILKGY